MDASHVVRRMFVMLLPYVVVSGQAFAQEVPVARPPESAPEADCLAVSPTSRVTVDTSGGQVLRGTLMCLSETGAWLMQDGRLLKMPLDDVRRIRTTADPVWDGAAKGAVIPLIIWAVLCHDCSAEPMLRASLAYGLVGLAIDALDSHRQTLYQSGGRSASVGWTFRF